MSDELINAVCVGCNTFAVLPGGTKEGLCAETVPGSTCNGRVLRLANRAAFEIGRLAHRMGQGYYAHKAALTVAANAGAAVFAPSLKPDSPPPIAHVYRNDGSSHTYNFPHYLDMATSDPLVSRDLERVWIVGAMLTLGDALKDNKYFDNAPELELVRHLRNGIAHGNRFKIDSPKWLIKFPAHNKLAYVKPSGGTIFEITAQLDRSPVLFDFMGPADCIDLLFSVEVYLLRMGLGERPRD
jgi:hypothetical protein